MSRSRCSSVEEGGVDVVKARPTAGFSRNRRHHWRRHALFALLGTTTSVRAQHTEAVCNVTSLSWSFNSLGQSPCLVAAIMANPCSTNDDYDVPAIGPGFHYNPSQEPSICECSTVTYNLYSACAACQDATVGPWSTYSSNCSKTSPDGQYALVIPSGTAVPAWAYQLVTASNRFNLTLGQSVGDTPENVTASSTTSSSTTSRTSTNPGQTNAAGGNNSNQNNNNSGNNNNGKKSNTGAIVGGVVGGIGGAALIGGLIAFFLIRRKRTNRAPSSGDGYGQYHDDQYRVAPFAGGAVPSVGGETSMRTPPPPSDRTGAGYTAAYQPVVNPVLSGRPYDPEDPSTFPPTGENNWSQGEPTLIGSSLNGPIAPGKWNQQEVRAEV